MPRWLVHVIVFVAARAGELLIWLSGPLGPKRSEKLAFWITQRFEPVTRQSRHANYRKFFPPDEMTPERLAAFDEAHHRYLGKLRAEVVRLCFRRRQPGELEAATVLEGEEHLRKILDSGRGMMLVSGHTGSWWFIPSVLAQRGFKVKIIFTPILFKKVERMMIRTCRNCGVDITFVGRDAWQAVKNAAARKEIVYLAFDVPIKPKRCELLPFGNAQLRIDSGPAIMAVKANLAVLQASCAHQPDGRTRVSIHPPTEIEVDPEKTTSLELCHLWGRRLGRDMFQHPEQWWAWGYVDLQEKQAETVVEKSAPRPLAEPHYS